MQDGRWQSLVYNRIHKCCGFFIHHRADLSVFVEEMHTRTRWNNLLVPWQVVPGILSSTWKHDSWVCAPTSDGMLKLLALWLQWFWFKKDLNNISFDQFGTLELPESGDYAEWAVWSNFTFYFFKLFFVFSHNPATLCMCKGGQHYEGLWEETVTLEQLTHLVLLTHLARISY